MAEENTDPSKAGGNGLGKANCRPTATPRRRRVLSRGAEARQGRIDCGVVVGSAEEGGHSRLQLSRAFHDRAPAEAGTG